jgi:hypothetical protein
VGVLSVPAGHPAGRRGKRSGLGCDADSLAASLAATPVPRRASHGEEDRTRAAAANKADEPRRIEAARQARLAALNALDQNSALHDWLEFTGPQDELRAEAFKRIRNLARRQSDAEVLFREGYGYLERDLPELDLQATAPICENSLRFFQGKLNEPDSIRDYMPGLRWMVEHKCDCGHTLDEFEKVVHAYDDSPERTQFLAEIADLRRR